MDDDEADQYYGTRTGGRDRNQHENIEEEEANGIIVDGLISFFWRENEWECERKTSQGFIQQQLLPALSFAVSGARDGECEKEEDEQASGFS